MDDELGQLVRRAAGDPDDAVDVDDVRARVRRRRRRRRLAGAGVGCVLVVAVVGSLAQLDGRSVTEVVLGASPARGPDGHPRLSTDEPVVPPAPGEVQPVWAPDGWPAFVTHDGDQVHMVRARSAHPSGAGQAVAYCPTASVDGDAGAFVDLFGDDIYTLDGHWAAGPGPTGLARYDVTRHADGRVTVGDQVHAPDRPAARDGGLGVDAHHGDCIERTDGGRRFDPDVAVGPGIGDDLDLARPEAAVEARPDGSWTVVDGVLTVDAHDTVRLCHDPSGQPCPPDAPRVAGIDPRHAAAGLPDTLIAGRFFVQVDDGDFTDLIIVSHSFQPVADPAAFPDPRRDVPGAAERVTVNDDELIVPAGDLFYGNPPTDPIPAGTYELTLVNYGDLTHTLVNDDLDLALETDPTAPTTTDNTRIELPPGSYSFYCRIPGHREHMTVTLDIE